MSDGPWVVKDVDGANYRNWGDWGPSWTRNPDDALQFFRRKDAEAFARDDEDAWYIVSLSSGDEKYLGRE